VASFMQAKKRVNKMWNELYNMADMRGAIFFSVQKRDRVSSIP